MASRRWTTALPLLLVLVLLCAAGCGGSSHKKCTTKGTEYVFTAIPQSGQQVTPAGMKAARRVINGRLALLPGFGLNATVRGSGQIVLHLPAGSGHTAKTAALATSTGQLQIFDLEADLAPPTVKNGNPTPYATLDSLLSAVRSEAKSGRPEAYYLFDAKHAVEQGPDPTRSLLLRPYGGKQPAGTQVLVVPANREVVSGQISPTTHSVGHSASGIYWYLFKYFPHAANGPPEVADQDLVHSKINGATDPRSGTPVVQLAFTKHGAQEFQQITKAEWQRGRKFAGRAGHAGQAQYLPDYVQHSAIVLDGALQSTPYIDYMQTALSHGVSGRFVTISMVAEGGTAAKDIAFVLRGGALPYSFKQVGRTPICAP
ncbi:MAG: SecDF P1 head subdomain-containing protein [Gaiellaceae bacterium]